MLIPEPDPTQSSRPRTRPNPDFFSPTTSLLLLWVVVVSSSEIWKMARKSWAQSRGIFIFPSNTFVTTDSQIIVRPGILDKLIVAEEKHNESTLAYQCMHEMTARVFFRREAGEGGQTIHMGENPPPPPTHCMANYTSTQLATQKRAELTITYFCNFSLPEKK